ncbi:MAG: hypothetical protein KAU62_02015 [Candidatus Heimdallarchaeota archaeon]|nr:hypothetical protein [Candidatus Heimdallarchaeota archaeon]MCK4609909.1 hypothetical protein [Candidatus Heimdallarchaeota archaeon]
MIKITGEKNHYNASIKNYNFYKLNKSNFPTYAEWAVTIMFYEVIHLIERVLAIAPIKEEFKHPHNHVQRYQIMRNLRKYIPKTILKDYRTLKNISVQARYNYGIVDEKIWKEVKNNEYKVLKEHFQTIYKDIKKLLK